MRKDTTGKFQHISHFECLDSLATQSVRVGLAITLVLFLLLLSSLATPFPGLAAGPLLETGVPPSSTPLQVTPPPTSTASDLPAQDIDVKQATSRGTEAWIRSPGWMLTFAGGILVWTSTIILLIGIALLFVYLRRRRRQPPEPPPTASIPFLKSADDKLYFRLDRLGGDGLIIGRGQHGIDLRIGESVPHADTVSSRHARIYFDALCGKVIIEDLGSTNGVFINGRRAPRKNLLKDGWVVGLGDVILTYSDGESDTGPLD